MKAARRALICLIILLSSHPSVAFGLIGHGLKDDVVISIARSRFEQQAKGDRTDILGIINVCPFGMAPHNANSLLIFDLDSFITTDRDWPPIQRAGAAGRPARRHPCAAYLRSRRPVLALDRVRDIYGNARRRGAFRRLRRDPLARPSRHETARPARALAVPPAASRLLCADFACGLDEPL